MSKTIEHNFHKFKKRKFLNNGIITSKILSGKSSVMDKPSETRIQKSYRRVFSCRQFAKLNEAGELSFQSCNRYKLCLFCQSMKAFERIFSLFYVARALPPMFFVTLTLKTGAAKTSEELKSLIRKRSKSWQRARIFFFKSEKRLLSGVRKLEITIRPDDQFHVHLHCLICGEEDAKKLVEIWLYLHSDASAKAQDIRPLTGKPEKAIAELVKYTHKNLKLDPRRKKRFILINPTKSAMIDSALMNSHDWQPFGLVRRLLRENKKIIAEKIKESKAGQEKIKLTKTVVKAEDSIFEWSQKLVNWFNRNQTPLLTSSKTEDEKIQSLF